MTAPEVDSSDAQPPIAPSMQDDAPAYELKFLIDESLAARIIEWAREHLALDPHGDPALGGAYVTTTLYCDTPQDDVYLRSQTFRRRKFRVRNYGNSPQVFVERKIKAADRVRKYRTSIPADDLITLSLPTWQDTWPGAWFATRIRQRGLGPAARVMYHRLAYVGSSSDGPLRLTIDRNLRGELAHEWSMGPLTHPVPLAPGRAIVELKFTNALPVVFKQLVAALNLSPDRVSKYRLCRDACGGANGRLNNGVHPTDNGDASRA